MPLWRYQASDRDDSGLLLHGADLHRRSRPASNQSLGLMLADPVIDSMDFVGIPKSSHGIQVATTVFTNSDDELRAGSLLRKKERMNEEVIGCMGGKGEGSILDKV